MKNIPKKKLKELEKQFQEELPTIIDSSYENYSIEKGKIVIKRDINRLKREFIDAEKRKILQRAKDKMTEEQEEKIVLKYARKYYPHDIKDWTARSRALAMVAEILRDISINSKKEK